MEHRYFVTYLILISLLQVQQVGLKSLTGPIWAPGLCLPRPELDRLLTREATLSSSDSICGQISFVSVLKFLPAETSKHNGFLHVSRVYSCMRGHSTPKRAVWWTSENALYSSLHRPAVPQPRDSWTRCALAGCVCSSLSSNREKIPFQPR